MFDSVTILGNIDLFWLLAAFGGGAFGAMIGALFSFGLTGVFVIAGMALLAATGDSTLLDYGAFGPVFGPHIAFVGGVWAAAYAGRQGLMKGRNIATPPMFLGRADVWLVGALAGAGGYVVRQLANQIPWFADHTDTLTFTITIFMIAARLIFGREPLFSKPRPSDPENGLAWEHNQSTAPQYLTMGAGTGLLGGGLTIAMVAGWAPSIADETARQTFIGHAHVLPFAISALTIFFLALGQQMPVTHHTTITSGFAGVVFLEATGSPFAALLIAMAFGIVTAAFGELVAKLVAYRADTYIDPPASIIWIMHTVVLLAAMPFGAAG